MKRVKHAQLAPTVIAWRRHLQSVNYSIFDYATVFIATRLPCPVHRALLAVFGLPSSLWRLQRDSGRVAGGHGLRETAIAIHYAWRRIARLRWPMADQRFRRN